MTLSARKQSDFVEYLLSFYGKDGVYGPSNSNPIFRRPMSKKEAVLATNTVGASKDFEGDSFDREKARDLVLSWRDSTPKTSGHAKKAPGDGLRDPVRRRHHATRGVMDFTDVRHEIDAATTEVDTEIDPMHLAMVASDAYEAGDKARHRQILANIPPIKLGRTVYRVVSGGRHGLDLVGPRGGYTSLVQSTNNPTAWAHNAMGGKTTWYRRNADWSFTAI